MNRLVPVVLLLAGLSLLACAGPTYYGVQYQLDRKNLVAADQQPPGPDARSVVKNAVTVAFFPPDACRETKSAGAGATELSNALRMRCGVLMAELESEAARAGFQVVSWQTLRGGTGRPIDYARENKVDLLFEINELSFDIPPQDLFALSNMSFFRKARSPYDAPQPLTVRDLNATGGRCQQKFYGGLSATAAVALDLKMVSVSDGRMHWVYRAVKAEEPRTQLGLTRTYEVPPSESSNFLVDFGLPIASAGLGFMLIGGIFYLADVEKETLPMIFIPLGGLALVGGAVMWAGGAVLAGFNPDYAAPDGVICAPGWIALEEKPMTVAEAPPTAGSSIQFAEQGKVSDPAEARRRELLKMVIREFMTQLQQLKQ